MDKKTQLFFQVLDQSTELLQDALKVSYLDAFIESGNNILENNIQFQNDRLDDSVTKKIQSLYQQVDYQTMDAAEVRQAIQMILIKAVVQDQIQANHQLTPDTIAFIISYLLTRIFKGKTNLSILDLAVGSGNLLMTIIQQLATNLNANVHGIGIDNDDSLLSVAVISAEMQRLPVDLVHQDAINNLLIDDVDLVVSDLPIGYYPIDENVQNYATRAKEGHSFAHQLMIEQGMNHVKPGGWGVFLVPKTLFQTPAAHSLLSWLQSHAYLQGMLNLPGELFSNATTPKAILILQRHGAKAHQAEQVMLGEFPSFKDQTAFQRFMAEIVEWERTTFDV